MPVDTDVLVWLFRGRGSTRAALAACVDVKLSATAVECGESLLTANLRRYRFLRDVSLEQYRP